MRKVVKTQVKEEVVRGFISTILPYVQSQLAWEKARMLGDIRERQEYGPDFYRAKEQQHKVLLKIIEDCVTSVHAHEQADRQYQVLLGLPSWKRFICKILHIGM